MCRRAGKDARDIPMAAMNILFSSIAGFIVAFMVPSVFAAGSAKLPYSAGARFVVTVGYETPPTHIKKDAFAIDFSQEECRAYGAPVVAALAGTAFVVSENGYNGGYGTQMLIRSPGGIVTRYAHLLAESIPVKQGDDIPQGTIIGAVGNTGMVAGAACVPHPGTHLHFAMYQEQVDGSFTPRKPEPISGFTGISVGSWYRSDNAIAATDGNLAALIALVGNLFGHTSITVEPTGTVADTATTVPGEPSPRPLVAFSPSGTVSTEEKNVLSQPSHGTPSLPPVTAPSSSMSSSLALSAPVSG